MKHSIRASLAQIFLLIFVVGSVHAQSDDEAIKSAFNENVDRVRLMVLLSPT